MPRRTKQQEKWEAILKRQGLGMDRGRMGGRLQYMGSSADLAAIADEISYIPEEDEHGHRVLNSSHGLVSSVYQMAPSGDYISDDERTLRTRNALKGLIYRRGRPHVEAGLRHADVSKSEQPVLDSLRLHLQSLPE